MHLLDAWSSLPLATLVRLVVLPMAVLLATLLPGRRVARAAALLMAAALLLLTELPGGLPLRAAAAALWLVVAWVAGAGGAGVEHAGSRRRSGLEAGALGLPLGLALAALMVAAVSRQPLPPPASRLASLGVLVLGASLLHLLMRRNIRRAAIGFAGLGLALELLAGAARALDVTHAGAPPGPALAGAALAVALTTRLALARERHAGSPLVSDAHDLHD